MSKLSETPSAKSPDNLTAGSPCSTSSEFSSEQRRILLRIAHDAILSIVERRPFADTPPALRGLAEARGVSFEEISRQTTENFFRLFNKVPRELDAAA